MKHVFWFLFHDRCVGYPGAGHFIARFRLLETRFRDFFSEGNKRPLYAFLTAQFLNVLITLAVALMLFS